MLFLCTRLFNFTTRTSELRILLLVPFLLGEFRVPVGRKHSFH